MATHQSNVNFKNLIQDLAGMYPYEIREIVLVETIANALDAKAERINISFDKNENVLVIQDNGNGMDKKTFAKYHDFSVSLKTRGSGIGFAGLGAKIAFNSAQKVITETRSLDYEAASNWYLKNERLIWEEIPARKISETGTYVEIHFNKSKVPIYASTEDIINIIKRHYTPLFIRQLYTFYSKAGIYSSNLYFNVDNIEIPIISIPEDKKLDSFKPILLRDKRGIDKGIGYFGLNSEELPDDERGIAISTYGKVIKREFLNIYPSQYTDKITGIIEVPQLIMCLTTSKTDFNKKGREWRPIRKIYEEAQNEFKNWLNNLGALPTIKTSRSEASKLERTIRQIINSLPEIEDFFRGPYRKKDVLTSSSSGISASSTEGIQITFPEGGLGTKGSETIPDKGTDNGKRIDKNLQGEKKASPISRKSRTGPRIEWIDSPGRDELGWVDQGIIYINEGHPAYKRAEKQYKYYHDLVSIAIAIARYTDKTDIEAFELLNRFFSVWGKL